MFYAKTFAKMLQNICKTFLQMFQHVERSTCWRYEVVTCKIKHLQNICKNVLEVVACNTKHFTSTASRRKTLKRFYNIFANVLFYMLPRVSKPPGFTFHNFIKYWVITKILSLAQSKQSTRNRVIIKAFKFQQTSNAWLQYLVKCQF